MMPLDLYAKCHAFQGIGMQQSLGHSFGESTMSSTQVQLWYNQLKECPEDVNDYAISGRPSMSTTDENIEAVKKMILDNCRITILEVADDVDISFGSWQTIFTDVLGMKNAAVKIEYIFSAN